MAKTKQDYYNDGINLAKSFILSGKMQNEGKPVSDLDGNPLPTWVGSWQAKSFWGGFREIQEMYLRHKAQENMREVSAQRKRELRKRGIVCQYLYTTVNGKARYGWTKNA